MFYTTKYLLSVLFQQILGYYDLFLYLINRSRNILLGYKTENAKRKT